MDIENEILQIQERNKKVTLDKAWEVSFIRRVFIAGMTYVFAAAWLYVISESSLWWKACVPVVGYLLSTLSLPQIKQWWMKKHQRV